MDGNRLLSMNKQNEIGANLGDFGSEPWPPS